MNVPPHRSFLPLALFLSLAAFTQAREVPLMEIDLAGATTGWGEIGKGKDAGGQPMAMRGTAYAEELFDSGRMTKGDAPKPVDVDLSGKMIVALRVTDSGDGTDSDYGGWANAAFKVSGAAPVSLPRWMLTLPHYEGSAALPADAKPAQTIKSPDGSVAACIFQQDGRLWISVLRGGKPALDASPIGVTINGADLGKDAEAGGARAYSADETYPWLGNQRTLTNHFNGAQFAMKTGPQAWTLDVRAYDDGVAWRCEAPGSGPRKVEGEATSFAMPAGSAYWTHTNTVSYEANFHRYEIDGDAPKTPVAMPVTVELPGGGFACYTEANTMGYSGMTFGVNGRLLNGIFEDDPKGWTMEGAFATPWRVVIAVDDLNALVNSSIGDSVCPPPDPKLFPKGILTDWIKPGRSYWTWIIGGWDTAQWDRIKGYVDDAAALNCQYYTIDDPWREPRSGWHRNGGDEWDSLKEICAYAAKKHVGIMVWQHWEGIRDLKARQEFFENVARAGAKGVKIDFMESESHDRLEFYQSCLEIAAKLHLLVNFHGANKPAGEARTWPNGLTREGIYGLEQRDSIEPQHLAALPFTRFVAGAGDFTPTGLDPSRLFGYTMVMQLATAVVYTSPIEHWADSAKVYLAQPPEVVEFIRTKPTVWDETRVLPGSRIGEVAAFARRSGKDWWIGILNGTEQARDFAVQIPALKAGKYRLIIIQDGKTRTQLEILKGNADVPVDAKDLSGNSFTAHMAPRGGYVMMVKAVD